MEFTPNKAWIFVYLFVVRILPDIHCRNKVTIEKLHAFLCIPYLPNIRRKAPKKINFMKHFTDYYPSKAMPHKAYTECIKHNSNKKGDLK